VGPEYPILAHADFGKPDCCGCVFPVNHGEEVEITCNECGAIVRTVLSADLRRTLDEMESQLVVASGICQNCGAVNLPRVLSHDRVHLPRVRHGQFM
jgi:hypothetical protein